MADTKDTGVYVIRNKLNDKRYVGSTSRMGIQQRWWVHKNDLKKGRHHSIRLQRSWNKHGPDVFEWLVIEKCEPAECVSREQVWIDTFDSSNPKRGYNISPTAGSRLGAVTSEETKQKQRLAKLGKKLGPRSEIHKQRLREAFKNRVVTENQKNRLREIGRIAAEANRGRKVTDDVREKMRVAAREREARRRAARPPKEIKPAYNFRRPEHREKIRQSLLGKKHTPERRENQRKARMAYLERTRNKSP